MSDQGTAPSWSNFVLDLLVAWQIDVAATKAAEEPRMAATQLLLQSTARPELELTYLPDGRVWYDLNELLTAFVTPLFALISELSDLTGEPVEEVVARLREHVG